MVKFKSKFDELPMTYICYDRMHLETIENFLNSGQDSAIICLKRRDSSDDPNNLNDTKLFDKIMNLPSDASLVILSPQNGNNLIRIGSSTPKKYRHVLDISFICTRYY